jgi:thiamine-monophosphate kinase
LRSAEHKPIPQFESLTREQRLVEAIKQWTGERLIGDDCAVLPGGLLVTSDTLVEGTHFLPSIKWEDLGWKAIAVNLSDIAAMAGRPRFITASLTLPASVREEKVEELYRGMVQCARTYRTRIVGGDLTQGKVVSVSVTALGDVHELGCIMRSTARHEDVVAVTGDFGAAGAALQALKASVLHQFPHLWQCHFRPRPRLCEAWALIRAAGARAALMDASDGLADALFQIGRGSGVGMDIDLSLVPVHEETRQAAELSGLDALDLALYGGEDYELVAAIGADAWKTLMASHYNPFVAIGAVSENSLEIRLKGQGVSKTLDTAKMFQHFQI